jgi:penicillin amidase
LGGKLPRLFGFDRGPVSVPGGRATVHQAQVFRHGGRRSSFVPSLRMVIDLAGDEIQSALAGGPSDRRFSRWYASGLADWLAGRYKRISLEPGRRKRFP